MWLIKKESVMRTGVIEMEEAIALTIKSLRKKHNFSQDSIATVLDVTKQNVSNIENGRANLTMPNLIKLSKLYGLKPSDILVKAESLVGKEILR